MDQEREELKNRFSFSRTVPGTKSYHPFVQPSINEIRAKRVSEDANNGIRFNFSNQPERIKIDELNPGKFVTSLFDEVFGLVLFVQQTRRMSKSVLCTLAFPDNTLNGQTEMMLAGLQM